MGIGQVEGMWVSKATKKMILCMDLADPFGASQAAKFALALYTFCFGFLLIVLIGNSKPTATLFIMLGVGLGVIANIMWGLAFKSLSPEEAVLKFHSKGSWYVHYLPVGIAAVACTLIGISIRIVG